MMPFVAVEVTGPAYSLRLILSGPMRYVAVYLRTPRTRRQWVRRWHGSPVHRLGWLQDRGTRERAD